MVQQRNDLESTIKFSKNGIMEYISQQFDFENNEEQSKLWDLKLSKDYVKVFIKREGSKADS